MYSLIKTEFNNKILCNICNKRFLNLHKRSCDNCYIRAIKYKRHLKSSLKRCECSPDCPVFIHSISSSGFPLRFFNGHQGRGKNHSQWIGGETAKEEYIEVYSPSHPFSPKNNKVMKHRLVLEKHFSEKYNMPIFILPYFDVHHKNGIKDDNRIENLMMVTKKHHRRLHRKYIDDRICSNCNKTTTYITPEGIYRWFDDHNGGYWCNNCYNKFWKLN